MCKVGVGRGEREKEHTHMGERERECLAPAFISFLPPGSALCKLGSTGSAVLPEVLTPVLGPFFDLPLFYFHGLFPFLSLPPPFWTPFPYSNYLTFPPQEMGGLILWEYGCQGLSGYFLLIWDSQGHWDSPSC